MFWGCFAASGTGCLDCVQGIMKSEDYQKILGRNVGPSVRKLGLRPRSWVFQQDNDPKHTSKSTQKWMKRKGWRVLKWPAMSPDLNPIEHLWRDLKIAVGRRHPSNMIALEQFAKEWSKIPGERCKKLVDGYRKRLISVFFFFPPKVVQLNIKLRVPIILCEILSFFCVPIHTKEINRSTPICLIALTFLEKCCIFWKNVKGANNFIHDCANSYI